MEKYFNFGETLMRLRRGKLLSQQELADHCGKSSSHISDLERGVVNQVPPHSLLLLKLLICFLLNS